ncbi:hypothetical protein FOL47_006557 [Perkinsus chesapeaki]|uniref:NADP-dependent oxidoreductase domain-containing protein n=1 Tax=Perkinsus chesapeaki TaxID=330153 RepID=A0A7J6LS36_PERCH|nr:hypothetical protein FOL47_006557 [Perkinsus chesapeaki]
MLMCPTAVAAALILSIASVQALAPPAPSVKLSNGMDMPMLGLGTSDSGSMLVRGAVFEGIRSGYRYIDTAFIYGNHKSIGEGINDAIQAGIVRREDLFVSTKLWMSQYRPDVVRSSVEEMLQDLGLDYLDQLLMHWPVAFERRDPQTHPFSWRIPRTASGRVAVDSSIRLIDTWREMEKLVDEGLVRSIGLSNFEPLQIDEILAACRIRPVVNQIEVHPYLPQDRVIDFCTSRGIQVIGYAPLGSPSSLPFAGETPKSSLEHPSVKAIAGKLGKTPAQVILRWNLQRGIIVIPKTIHRDRLLENLNVFDFQLSRLDMAQIDTIGQDPVDRVRIFNPDFYPRGKRVFTDVDATELHQFVDFEL